jgi:hypothetical protein
MMSMTVAGALNLVWVAAALVAMGLLTYHERRRYSRLRDRFRRGFAVFLAAVALFPCISASDDFVRFGQMSAGPGAAGEVVAAAPDGSGESHAIHLARLLQVLESFQLSAASRLLVTLGFCSLVVVAVQFSQERSVVSPSSRAPPLVLTTI